MKHCDNCSKDFDTAEKSCPACRGQLRDVIPNETEAAEIAATMSLTGNL